MNKFFKNTLITTFLLTSASTFAAVPHTFVAGTKAKASEVNDNFTALDDRIATLEGGTSSSLVNATTYTPAPVATIDNAYNIDRLGSSINVSWILAGESVTRPNNDACTHEFLLKELYGQLFYDVGDYDLYALGDDTDFSTMFNILTFTLPAGHCARVEGYDGSEYKSLAVFRNKATYTFRSLDDSKEYVLSAAPWIEDESDVASYRDLGLEVEAKLASEVSGELISVHPLTEGEIRVYRSLKQQADCEWTNQSQLIYTAAYVVEGMAFLFDSNYNIFYPCATNAQRLGVVDGFIDTIEVSVTP